MIPVEANGNCLFSSVCQAVDCPFGYQTIHLKCQLVIMLANHHNFLFPIFKASIATTYGFPRMPEEEYLQKYDDGTLTQEEADDHNMPRPFSHLGYMKALLNDGFWGYELCLALISMMWQISITVLKGETFHQIKFRHTELLKNANLVLVHCQAPDYVPASKFFLYNLYLMLGSPGIDAHDAQMVIHAARSDISCHSCLEFVKLTVLVLLKYACFILIQCLDALSQLILAL